MLSLTSHRAGNRRFGVPKRWRNALGALLALSVLAAKDVCAQTTASPQLVINEAVPHVGSRTLTIAGQHFGRMRPLVTLDLIPLDIQLASDTHIVAGVPLDLMPAGEYLLTVSRGPTPLDNGTITVKLGGDAGDAPAAGSARAPTDDVALTPLAAGEATAARVGDREITLDEVDREWRRSDPAGYLAVSRRLYEMRRRTADRIVGEALVAREAAARGTTPEALLAAEIPRRIVTLPDSAVAALYQSLGENARGATLEQLRPAIRAWLRTRTEPELARMAYLEELMKTLTKAEILLAVPQVRVEVTPRDPTLGPADAPVEIVAFGDFQRAEYAALAQAYARARETFGNRLRIVFKHLPATGPESALVAEAAQCAHAQGRFWPYHDLLVAAPRAITASSLKQTAREAGLAAAKFDACLDAGEHRGAVRSALEEAARYDIVGSPSFLVNGRLAPPPPPFLPPLEYLARLVEEALRTRY